MTMLRHEDERLVTGTGRFTADWSYPGQLHAVVVRADRAHAAIQGIDVSKALAVPGVVRILTAADVARAGYQPIPSGPDLKGAGGQAIRKAPLPLLAADRVRFVGQPIAMVLAETVQVARGAADLVEVSYEDLPAVASFSAATADDAPQLHDAAPGNLSLTYESGDRSAVEAAFAKAARASRLRIVSQRLSGAPMEPRACVVRHDRASGVTTVHTPTQGLLGMRSSLSTVTGIPPEQLEIVALDVGGSFGLRGGTYPEQALLVLAARELDRPVKWVSNRSELFIGEWHGRALVLNGEIAFDANDRIIAIRFDDEVDLGAYNCYFGGFIGTGNLSVTMGGAYAVPALYMRSRLAFTNTVPVSAYRGAGRPDIAFAIERLLDHAAAEHGLDPIELRRRNFVPLESFPYTTANGTEYDCGNFPMVMDKALALADYAGFGARRRESEARGRLRGIGLGYYLEKSGAGGVPKDEVAGEFDRHGRLTLYAVTGPSGQGHETSFAQIVGERTGLDPAAIRYVAGESRRDLVGNGTGGSRSLYGAGSAFIDLAARILDNARPHAARRLGVDESALRFEQGAFVAGSARITVAELARALGEALPPSTGGQRVAHPLDARGETSTGANFPNGCHIAEVEIDRDTGAAQIVSYVSVDDLGTVVSPALVRGQVHGGVVQGAGQAFCEQVVYDPDTAQLLSGSFMDYAMPRAGMVPRFVSETCAVPTKLNELGAKGVGESGCSGSLPALSNAVSDALRSAGKGPIDMPYTPARLWAALQ